MYRRLPFAAIFVLLAFTCSTHAAIVNYEASGTIVAISDPQGHLSEISLVPGASRFTVHFSYDTDSIAVLNGTYDSIYAGINLSADIDGGISVSQGAQPVAVFNDHSSVGDQLFSYSNNASTGGAITGSPLAGTYNFQILLTDRTGNLFDSLALPENVNLNDLTSAGITLTVVDGTDSFAIFGTIETLTRIDAQPPLNVLLTPTEAASFDTDGDGLNDIVDPLPSDPNVAVDTDADGTPDRFDPAPDDAAYMSHIDGSLGFTKKPPLDFWTVEDEPLVITLNPQITDTPDTDSGFAYARRRGRDPLTYIGVDFGDDGVVDGFMFFKPGAFKWSRLAISPSFFASPVWDLSRPGTYDFRVILFATTGLEYLQFPETATVTVERAGVVNVVDTGVPIGPNGAALRADQWLAQKFTITEDYTVTDVSGYMLGQGYPASVVAAIYTDAGNLPGTKLYSRSFDIESTHAYNYGWEGAGDLDWYLTPGTYWLAFEVTGDYIGGMLETGPICCTRVAYTAFDGQWRLGAYDKLGIRIDGAPNGAVCGNGDLELGEQCDDGNLVDGDMCSSACQSERLLNDSPGVTVRQITNADGTVDYSFVSNGIEVVRIHDSRGLLDLSGTAVVENSGASGSGESYAATYFLLNPEVDLASAGATKSVVVPFLRDVCVVDEPIARAGGTVGCDSRSPGYVHWPVAHPCGDPGNPTVGYSLAGTPLPQYSCEKFVRDGEEYARVSGLTHSLVASVEDLDGDGYPAGEDCDNTDPAIFPGAIELLDNVDNNCNGLVDEGFNLPPVADAGDDRSIVVGSAVTLDGSGSADPDSSGALSFQWTLLSRPESSLAGIADPQVTTTEFVADVEGTYEVLLVVSDGELTDWTSLTITASKATKDKAIDVVSDTVDVIGALPAAVFRNKNNRKALINKLDALMTQIRNGAYTGALYKLRSDVLRKADGCAVRGEVDKNDWMTKCEVQAQVYPLLSMTLELLEQLGGSQAKMGRRDRRP